MKKILIPTALAFALTASGAAFAGSAAPQAGGYTSPFDNANAYQQSLNKGVQADRVASTDRQIRTDLQQASTVTTPRSGWDQWIPASRDDLYSPE